MYSNSGVRRFASQALKTMWVRPHFKIPFRIFASYAHLLPRFIPVDLLTQGYFCSKCGRTEVGRGYIRVSIDSPLHSRNISGTTPGRYTTHSL